MSGAADARRHETQSRPPNILLLFSDQFRFDAMGCAGNRVVKTPALDRLAREGAHFTHAVTPTP